MSTDSSKPPTTVSGLTSRDTSFLRSLRITFKEVRGQGSWRVQGDYVSTGTGLEYHQYLVRLVCRSELADEICGRIASAAWTGRKGIVYTTPVHTFA